MSALRLARDDSGRGDGPTFVLLHGFASNRAYWRPVFDRLARHGRVLAFDLPGHGASLDHPMRERTARMADALVGELEALGVSGAHLAGHSMGGSVACLVALKRPVLAASLALLAPGGFGPAIGAGHLRSLAGAARPDEVRAAFSALYAGGEPPEATVAAAVADRAQPGAAARFCAVAGSFLRGEEQGVLPLAAIAALGKPLHVLWGRRDAITPVEQAEALAPVFRARILEEAGHALVGEDNAAVLETILAGAGLSPPSGGGAS